MRPSRAAPRFAPGSPRQNRNQLIQQCAEGAAISNYEGWRQSTKGKRFKLKGVRLFNVTELDGARAAAVSRTALLAVCRT